MLWRVRFIIAVMCFIIFVTEPFHVSVELTFAAADGDLYFVSNPYFRFLLIDMVSYSGHVFKKLSKPLYKWIPLSVYKTFFFKKISSWHQKNELWKKTAAVCGICSSRRDRVWSGCLEVCRATVPDSHVTFPSLYRFACDKPPDGAPLGTGNRHGVIHFIMCVWQPLTLMKFGFRLLVGVFCFNLDRYNFPWLCLNLVIKDMGECLIEIT